MHGASLLAAIPQPPVHDVMPKTAEWLFTAALLAMTCIALVIAVRQLAVRKDPLLLYCVIGGALGALFEPIVDVLGMCFLKEHGAIGTYTYLGRTIPLYLLFAYPWYNGGLAYLYYRLMQRGVSTRTLFALWAATGVADVLEETPGILAHTYLYYGKQPFDIWGFPLWWAFVNPLMPLLAGALIYRLRPRIGEGWKLLGIIPLIPMAGAMVNAATATPVWITLNLTHTSYLWTYLGGLATLVLALYSVWIISCAVMRPAEELVSETLGQQLKTVLTESSRGVPISTPVAARQQA
ncbi:MAG: hypothetical protein ACYDHH_22095 [Solirubrobacteraceae bacterium]